MPELPEVEAARVLVQTHCKGKCIQKAIAADDTSTPLKISKRPMASGASRKTSEHELPFYPAEVIENIAPTELQDALQGKTLVEACRKGKHLWLELDSGSPALMLHFGMTGYIVRLHVCLFNHAIECAALRLSFPS